MKSKRVARNGSVTIPKDLRAAAGILPGRAIDLMPSKDATGVKGVFVRTHVPTCSICGSMMEVQSVLGIEICLDCGKKIAAACAEAKND